MEERYLVRAYSRLEGTRSVSEVAGPSIAAGLYSALGVASLLIDAASYLVSAACFKVMKPWGVKTVQTGSVWSRLTLGFRLNWADPVLRKVVLAAITLNCGGPVFVTVLPILAYRGLGMSVAVFGIASSAAAMGAVLGALVAPKVAGKLGTGRTMAWSLLLHCLVGLGALAGGLGVSLLTDPMGVLNASRLTMAAGTILAAFSFVSAIRIQPLLDAAQRDKETAAAAGKAPELAQSAS